MNSPIIKPTIGRRVWFRPSAAFLASNPTLAQLNPEQPMDAGIVYVQHDHMVNLIVTDHVGKTLAVPSVPLLAGHYVADEDTDVYCCCEWMPYQKGQAAKTEAADKGIVLEPKYREPTQREQLEYALVSGAASALAISPGNARQVVDGIKVVLDMLHPSPATTAEIASTTLPVVDPGPDSLEREIQAKADKAPRVTPAELKDEIASVHYFTAADGARMSPDGNHPIQDLNTGSLGLLTFCVLVLRNGFTVVGHSACASPANFNTEIGQRIARENAERQIWPLLGFRLRDELDRPVLTDADAAADLAGTPRPTV